MEMAGYGKEMYGMMKQKSAVVAFSMGKLRIDYICSIISYPTFADLFANFSCLFSCSGFVSKDVVKKLYEKSSGVLI